MTHYVVCMSQCSPGTEPEVVRLAEGQLTSCLNELMGFMYTISYWFQCL